MLCPVDSLAFIVWGKSWCNCGSLAIGGSGHGYLAEKLYGAADACMEVGC